jgi:hypothetical protein
MSCLDKKLLIREINFPGKFEAHGDWLPNGLLKSLMVNDVKNHIKSQSINTLV